RRRTVTFAVLRKGRSLFRVRGPRCFRMKKMQTEALSFRESHQKTPNDAKIGLRRDSLGEPMGTKWPITWGARWVWAQEPANPQRGIAPQPIPPRETWNRFCYLRRTFDIESIPESVPARVSADSRFILYINGVEAARGPARSLPARLAWSELDLAPLLRVGRNSIAAIVRFYGAPNPWWIPAPASFQLGLGSFAFEAPDIDLMTDGSWKGIPAPFRQAVKAPPGILQPPTEILDGGRVPVGWSEVEFDDSAWPAAVQLSAGTFAPNRTRIPAEPYPAPEAADIAPLTSIAVTLGECARKAVSPNSSDDPLESFPEPSENGSDHMIS